MAKGQKRSNREIKKPKKNVAAKAKAGATASFMPASDAGRKPGGKAR